MLQQIRAQRRGDDESQDESRDINRLDICRNLEYVGENPICCETRAQYHGDRKQQTEGAKRQITEAAQNYGCEQQKNQIVQHQPVHGDLVQKFINPGKHI